VKLPIALLFNLYTTPQEVEDKPAVDTWIIGPALKMVAEFEESVKKYPLIPMGTPDPYRPPE
jgi:arylsulfatase